jgi:hypothetical protein
LITFAGYKRAGKPKAMVDSLIKKKEAIRSSSLIFIAVDEFPLANLQNNIVLCNTRYYKLLYSKKIGSQDA